MSTKTLDWYIPDKVRLQGYLEQLRACDNMIEVVEQVVKAMILDDNKRANAGTVYKSAFFEALRPYFGKLEGGVTYATFNRRCNEMIHQLSKEERLKAIQAVLAEKASGRIEIEAPKSEEGKEGRIRIVLEIPYQDTGKLHLSSGMYELECKEIILRGFDAAYVDRTLCCYEMQGGTGRMADALECLAALSDEEALGQVHIHYIYNNIDRDGLSLRQAILLARHARK
ncbi:hypothetical protein [Parabacteroides distasonis]|jgi:hypothetical protein|uniref:hypothetical protein n=1 Tax=Parabacteroides distasonis TaxID=823 RepID=UPI0039B68AEF